MKKILEICVLFLVIVYIGVEVYNFYEYNSILNEYKREEYKFGFPPPSYHLIITQGFYRLFPSLAPRNNLLYKPVIYLYPTNIEKIKVQLDYKGTIIADYPNYDFTQKGWTVTAFPDGKIIGADEREYSYLFWEGEPSTQTKYDLSTGFIIRGEDSKEFLQNTLSKIGLTPKEYNEFIVYWYPKMKDNKYNLIHFAGDEYTNTAPLKITPKPDSILRVFMVFKPLDNSFNIKPQEIKPFIRNGFTVVEWGGSEL